MGSKLADAHLLGYPYIVIIGKNAKGLWHAHTDSLLTCELQPTLWRSRTEKHCRHST